MKKILIVEDETIISLELQKLLQNSGYEATILKNFTNSKENILKEKADLILLDINLPKINGEILLKEIRKKSVRIIMKRHWESISMSFLFINTEYRYFVPKIYFVLL